MWRTLQDRLLLVLVALLLLFVASLALVPFFARDYRRVAIVGAAGRLVEAYTDYTNGGSFTNSPRASDISLSSNTVTIGNTQYQCVVQSPVFHMGEQQGTLAMTSNRTFIWLGSNGPPKIIRPGYKPPLFGY